MEYQPLPPHVGLVTPQMSWLSISLSHSRAFRETRLFRVRVLMMSQKLMRVSGHISQESFPLSASSARKIMEAMKNRRHLRHLVDTMVSLGLRVLQVESGRDH